MGEREILAGMLSAVACKYTECGKLNHGAASAELMQNGVRVVVVCRFCRYFEGLKKQGWCNRHSCIRNSEDYCSYGERRK